MSTISYDNKERPLLAVQSIPLNPFEYVEATTPSINAGAQVTINVTTTPASNILTLWNHLFSIRVDTNDDEHLFPDGDSLSGGQANAQLAQWIDYASSSDESNIRVHKIAIRNNDSVAHVYHILYKAYVIASVSGSQT